MSAPSFLRIGGGLLFIASLLLGCGKSENPSSRFNESLGSQGAPTISANVDMAYKDDGTSYKGAPVPGAAPAPSAAPAAAGGPEAEAVQKTIKDALTAVQSLDLVTLLDAFPPDQVAEVKKEETATELGRLKEEFDRLVRVLQDKCPPMAEKLKPEAAASKLDALMGAVKVQVVGPDTAAASLDPAALGQLAASQAQGGAQGGGLDPSQFAAQAAMIGSFSLQLKKVDGAWRISLPHSLSDKDAELARDGATFARNLMLKLEEKLDGVTEKLDEQAFGVLAMGAFGELAPDLAALQEKARGVLAAWAGAAPAGDNAPKPDQAPAPTTPEPSQNPRRRNP